MRVFHLSANVFEPLPAEHSTRQIWAELSQGCEGYHVVASAGRLTYSHSVEGNLHLHLLPALGTRGWQFFLTSWFSLLLGLRYRPDRIVAQCPVNGGLAAVALGRVIRAPVLLEVHGSHYFQPLRSGQKSAAIHAFFRFFSRVSFALASKVRSLSRDMTERLGAVYGADVEKKVVEIGNRVNLQIFSPQKSSYEIAGSPTIVSVGAFTRTKGHLALIEHVLPQFPGVRLVLVGRGPLKEQYVARARALGVAGRLELRYAPTHQDVARVLREADIYIHTASAEAVPRAILEAMAVGLPVIATKVGFLGGVVEDGRDALLVPAGQSRPLIEALQCLLDSRVLRERLGTTGAAVVRERFEWCAVFNRYRGLIAGLQIP